MAPDLGHLKGREGEFCEQLDEAQGPPGVLVHHKGEDDFMCPQKRDERQSGLGESGERARPPGSFWPLCTDCAFLSVSTLPPPYSCRVMDALPCDTWGLAAAGVWGMGAEVKTSKVQGLLRIE